MVTCAVPVLLRVRCNNLDGEGHGEQGDENEDNRQECKNPTQVELWITGWTAGLRTAGTFIVLLNHDLYQSAVCKSHEYCSQERDREEGDKGQQFEEEGDLDTHHDEVLDTADGEHQEECSDEEGG